MYFIKVILETIYQSKSMVRTLNYVFGNNTVNLFTNIMTIN